MTNDKVMSQADIDALVGGTAASQPASLPPPPTPAAPPLPAAPPPAAEMAPPVQPPQVPGLEGLDPAAIFDTSQDTVQTGLDKLAARITVSEPLQSPSAPDPQTQRLDSLDARITQSTEAAQQAKAGVDSMTNEVRWLIATMQQLMEALPATLGYNAQKTFSCNNCHTVGTIVTPVTCTTCGQSQWQGWYPPAAVTLPSPAGRPRLRQLPG